MRALLDLPSAGIAFLSFFDAVVQPLLGRDDGVVYVLPEMRPVHEAFGGQWMALRQP